MRLMQPTVRDRALQSRGTSGKSIYVAVDTALTGRHPGGGTILDVGCGVGRLWPFIRHRFDTYAGADVVRYDELPSEVDFFPIDLDAGRVPIGDGSVDVVVAVETIEHLENPRAFFRELVRICKPGGWIVVSTPNQLSLLSKLCLVLKNEFCHFQKGSYPAHLTALLEIDLRRIAAECALTQVAVSFTHEGRIPGTGRYYPRMLSRLFPRALSDNIIVVGQTPSPRPLENNGFT